MCMAALGDLLDEEINTGFGDFQKSKNPKIQESKNPKIPKSKNPKIINPPFGVLGGYLGYWGGDGQALSDGY